MGNKVLPSLVGLALLAGPLLAAPPLTRYTFSERHMGTTFKIMVYAPDEATAKRGARAAFARIAQLDGIMSDYRPTSELMQLSRKAVGKPVKVSDELFFVLAKSKELSEKSGGAFDVTVGPVVKLWRRARKGKRLPDPEELAAARALVGYKMMKLDPKAHTVELARAGMQLDLGAIGKGYAGDEAVKVLKGAGLSRVLVAAAGDIVAGDAPPGADGWVVGIAPLTDPEGKPERYVLLNNSAVSTAGDVEQFVENDGKRYSHIVDPHTGMGILGRFSVTVTAKNGLTSDGLDTTVAVLGPQRGLRLVEETPGAAVLFVRKTDKGEEVFKSKRWREHARKGK
jgi:thiamine biosynthesis lipoprotein